MRDPRYDVLFEPVQLGPVTARNRFFQVPHCNGMGHHHPTAHAHMRGVKAEGGWAVVCTEEVEIHPTSEVSPYIEGRLWDDSDIPALRRMTEKIHEHGSLAGFEPVHNGIHSANMYSREIGLAVANLPVSTYDPVQVRRMDADDIAAVRRWHRAASRRALEAGFDVVYVYAAHGLNSLGQFLSRRYNTRTDGYGGSLENRARLLREILEDTLDEVDGRAAVACRITVDELLGPDGIDRADIEGVFGLVGELPDVWDFVVGEWENDSSTSRFAPEAPHEQYVRGLKALTSKPVVGVGRFTSPDTMVRMIRDGVLDMIGAARPSIADPFLPKKIEEGRLEDIRECIGCNICVSGDGTITPIRCTQNPSMGEEWRRGWHPERMRPKTSDATVLVVGAGPRRAGGGDVARPPRPSRRPRRGDRCGGRPGGARGAPARARRVDPRPRLPARPARAAARRRGRLRQPAHGCRGAGVRVRPRRRRDRLPLAGRRRRPLAPAAARAARRARADA